MMPIRTSYQPGRWWVEVYIAEQKGWFKKMGLDVTGASFTSGALQIAAGASGSWDIAGSGNIPSVLGAARYGLISMAIADLEDASTAMVALPKSADNYLNNPVAFRNKVIPLTTNSSSHWVATACLEKKFHLAPNEFKFLNLSPPEIDSALSSGKYDVAAIWSPYIYVLQSTINAKVICTGREVGAFLTSNLLVQPSFAKAHPDEVAKFLAVYEHAVAWERLHPKETEKYLAEFYRGRGVQIPDSGIPDDLKLRPAFNLTQQLGAMHRPTNGMSQFDTWMQQTAEFEKSVGMIPSVPDVQSYVTDKYMRMVQDDPQLRKFAMDGRD
ncbi:MAG: ABC transporter substrate-binding protein [Vulcanimicrobiaceae bacterium]